MLEAALVIINSALDSPLILSLTFVYIVSDAISIYDTRLIQWRQNGMIPKDTPSPPNWTGVFGILSWVTIIVTIILEWQYGLLLWLIIYILKIIPVMETIGGVIVKLLIPRSK